MVTAYGGPRAIPPKTERAASGLRAPQTARSVRRCRARGISPRAGRSLPLPPLGKPRARQAPPAGRRYRFYRARTRSLRQAEQLVVVARDSALGTSSGERRSGGASEEIRGREPGAAARPWRQDHGAKTVAPAPELPRGRAGQRLPDLRGVEAELLNLAVT